MFSWKVATRFLKSSRSQTLFIILGIAIGVSVQVFVGILIQSLQKSLVNRTVGNSSHITILPQIGLDRIENSDEIISKIENITGVTKIATATDGNAFINNFTNPVISLLKGFDLEKANTIFGYYNSLEGKKPQQLGEVLIGKELTVDYPIHIGDNLSYNLGKPPYNVNYSLKVVGIFDLGVASLNRLWVIGTVETINTIFNYGEDVTSINIQVDDVFNADIIAELINSTLNDSTIRITNWKSENASLLSGLNGQTISSVLIQVFVLVSVLIGIASVLAITVLQKSRQIGILKAMGVNDKQASQIFLLQGFLLGLFGAIVGVVLGVGLMTMFTTFAKGQDGKPIIELFIDYNFILLSALIATLASTFASLIPARRSSKLNVIEVIRNG